MNYSYPHQVIVDTVRTGESEMFLALPGSMLEDLVTASLG